MFQMALRLSMRRTLTTLAVIALLFSAGSAWKAEAGEYTVLGAGASSCGNWTKVTNEKGLDSPILHNWLLGYITAYNRWGPYYSAPGLSNISKGTDVGGLLGWIDNYCKANPLKDLDDAAHALIFELLKH